MAKLKVAGTWAGVLEIELEKWTVTMLREEVAKRSNVEPSAINLICAGRVLRDGDGAEKLSQLGIRNNAKILAVRVSSEEGKSLKDDLMAEEERTRRLARVKSVLFQLIFTVYFWVLNFFDVDFLFLGGFKERSVSWEN